MGDIDLGIKAEKILQSLGKFGQDPDGGTSRLLYTSEWVEAQRFLKTTMEEEGLSTYYDEIGNLYGRLEGEVYGEQTILTGSHVDTVKNAGIYDGQYGIVAGLVALSHLKKIYGRPLRNLEVVSFAEEEGSRFNYTFWGSKNFCGLARAKDVEALNDVDGVSFTEAMQQAGFSFRQNPSFSVRQDVKTFLELHIEQGGVLEIEGKALGVVNCIVGQKRINVQVHGEANHAGTTPMRYRNDSLYASSLMICKIMDIAYRYGEPLVATVGHIQVKPNVSNVIPSNTAFSIDIRHIDEKILAEVEAEISIMIKEIAQQRQVTADVQPWMSTCPVPMNTELVNLLKNQCEKLELSYKVMPSGAGHDSQIIAPLIPTAMLFVPSRKGISHSPLEYTKAKCLGDGINVLVNAFYELAYKK